MMVSTLRVSALVAACCVASACSSLDHTNTRKKTVAPPTAPVGHDHTDIPDAPSASADATVGPQDETPAPAPNEVEAGVAATYAETVHPLLVRWCSECHGSTRSPLFAVADPKQSEQVLLQAQKVDLMDVEASRIVQRLRADRHNCPVTPGCDDAANQLSAALSLWAKAQITAASDTPTLPVTAALTFKDAQDVPAGGANPPLRVLSFDLSGLTKIQGAKLTIEIKDYAANSYIFKHPTLVLPVGTVHIRDLRLLVNGAARPEYATYTSVDQEVKAPGGRLSNAALVALKDLGIEQDQFSFAFGAIELK